MKKLLIGAAALVLSAATMPAFVVSSQAAAKSPYCSNHFEAWNLGWQEYYGCYGGHARYAVRAEVAPGQGVYNYCNNPFEKWNLSWNEHYGCYHGAPHYIR